MASHNKYESGIMKEAGRFGRWLGLLGALAQPGEMPRPEKPREEKMENIKHDEHKKQRRTYIQKENDTGDQEEDGDEEAMRESSYKLRESLEDFTLRKDEFKRIAERYLLGYHNEDEQEFTEHVVACLENLEVINEDQVWGVKNNEGFWAYLTPLLQDEYALPDPAKENPIVGLQLQTSVDDNVGEILFYQDRSMSPFDDRVYSRIASICIDQAYREMVRDERESDAENKNEDELDTGFPDTGSRDMRNSDTGD